jgi:ketosteroid isomerase-like protein
MQLIRQPITGSESTTGESVLFSALINFYAAFNNRDFDRMQANWLLSDQASMSNPLGGIKRGWREISGVYEKIFNGPAAVYVEFYDYSIHATDSMFTAVGRERCTLEINSQCIELAIRTSRIYILHGREWKQLHHHGSMDNPQLLAAYQSALLRN